MVAVPNLPDDPQRLLNRARALADQDGQQAAAIALLDRVIALDANQLEAELLYVQLLQRAKDHARVAALLDRVSPHWTTQAGYELANVCVAWSTSLTALSRAADAERVLRRAVTAAPAYTNPAIALATLLVDQNRRKDADRVLDDFVARLFSPTSLDTYSLKAVADFYRQHNDLPKSLALYLKAYKRDQVTDQFLYADLALLYEQLGNDAEAIRIDEQLLDYFQKAGSAFDGSIKSTRSELDRLHAKTKRH